MGLLLGAAPVPSPEPPRRFVYGADATYAPYDYLDEAGQPQGFDVELVRALARDAGVEVEIRLGAWDRIRGDFDSGAIDLLSLSFSEERGRTYEWLTQTWTTHRSAFFLPGRASYPRNQEELGRETVAVAGRSAAAELLAGLPPDQRPSILLVSTHRETCQRLLRGEATALVGSSVTLRLAAAREGIPELVEVPLQAVPYGLVTQKGRRAELEWVPASMERLRKAGAVEALAERFLSVPAPAWTRRNYAFLALALLGVAGALVAVALLWSRSLRGQVAARTLELESALEGTRKLTDSLRLSEDRYRTFLSLSTEGIARFELHDPVAVDKPEDEQLDRILGTARLTECNAAFVRILGRPEGDVLVGRPLTDLAPALELAVGFRAFLRGGYRLVGRESVQVLRDGSTVPVSANAIGVVEKGALKAIWLTQREITGQKQAEKSLRESEERFGRLAAASFEAIAITVDGVFVDGNEQLATMMGCDLPSLIGRRALEFVAEQDRDLVALHDTSGSEEVYSYLARRVDGTLFPVETRAKPIPYKEGTARVTALRDITEQLRAEEALRGSERKYRDIVDFAPIGIVQVLPEGTIVTANKAFARLLGHDRVEDVLGLDMARDVLVDPEMRERPRAGFAAAGRGEHTELLAKRKDGTRFWVEAASRIVDDPRTGRIFESFAQDITARKEAEEALRVTEERYRLLFEGNPLPMLVSDAETLRVLAGNEAAVRQYGYTREELLALSVPDLAVKDANLELYVATRLDPRPDVLHVGLRQQVRKDGSVVDIDLTVLRILFGGRPANMALARDVTAERKAQVERDRLNAVIQQASAEWQRTVDAVDTCVLILDGEARLKRINRAARELLGQDYPALLERKLEDLGLGEPWRTAVGLVRAARTKGGTAVAQAADEAKKRTWDVSAYLAAPSATGEDRTILSLRDITRIVALQESLSRSEAMSAMGSLVAGVAHEVRNPLFSISATLDAFEGEFGARMEFAEYTALLRSQVVRLTQLMRDLLDYGKTPSLRVTETRLRDVIHRAARSCGVLGSGRGVRISEEVPDELPAIPLDADRMEQVFENLIANAIQHSPKGSAVRVRARLSPDGPAPEVVCTLEDEGPGLAEGDIPHLFQPFFSRRKGGTGLGLSIVQRIVESHGGRVTAANRAGGGSVFTLTLPRRAASTGGTEG